MDYKIYFMSSLITRLTAYNKGLSPDLLKLKWDALRESPFRFYRGTCNLFAEDFCKAYKGAKKINVWLCADPHFENFGSFKGQNRLVYFDINDFDESILATPEIDITRFLTSIIIAGTQMHAKQKEITKVLQQLLAIYCTTLSAGKAMMMEKEVAHGSLKKYFEQLEKRNRTAFVAKKTLKTKAGLTIKTDGIAYIEISEAEKKSVKTALARLLKKDKHFSELKILDVAFRVAGTGSLGLERYVLLCYNKNRDKYYFLDVKESRRSCFATNVKTKQPHFANEAERTIYAEWVMQFCTPGYIEKLKIGKKWFVVKEMQPTIDKIAIESFNNNFVELTAAATNMVPLLAYAHIRSTGHGGACTADELIQFSKKVSWQKDVLALAQIMADKNDKYYKLYISDKAAT